MVKFVRKIYKKYGTLTVGDREFTCLRPMPFEPTPGLPNVIAFFVAENVGGLSFMVDPHVIYVSGNWMMQECRPVEVIVEEREEVDVSQVSVSPSV